MINLFFGLAINLLPIAYVFLTLYQALRLSEALKPGVIWLKLVLIFGVSLYYGIIMYGFLWLIFFHYGQPPSGYIDYLSIIIFVFIIIFLPLLLYFLTKSFSKDKIS